MKYISNLGREIELADTCDLEKAPLYLIMILRLNDITLTPNINKDKSVVLPSGEVYVLNKA